MSEPEPFTFTGIGAVAKYNPHLWGPEELKAIFVARRRELTLLTEVIKGSPPEYSPQHILLIGQRGMGKTTLLQRIALQVEEDEELSKLWLPLRFPEEQYTVSNLAELWSNVLGALADALEAKGESTQLIDQNLLLLESMPVEEREKETLFLINHWCEQNNQRLLLLVDSTDLLFDNLSDSRKGKKDAGSLGLWRLRRTLQNNPNFFWLGGSYQALEADDLYHDAFQDFFQLVELRPLTLEEMQQAMLVMAKTFGTGRGLKGEEAEKEIKQALTQRPERLKTLRQLTGGNPRTTVMLFELFAAGGSDQVRSDLERLLDMMTPLYKARLEALAEQPRKILAHIMESWQPISLGELAKVSGLPNTKISPQLLRMEKDGLVSKAELPNTSRAGYQAAERFFNIWYLMRNAPRRLKLRLAWLVEFMRLWYKPDELEHIARQRLERHGGRSRLDELEYSRAVACAMPSGSEARLSLDYQVYKSLQKQRQQLSEYFDFDGDDKPFQSIETYDNRFVALRRQLEELPHGQTNQDKVAFCHLVLTSLNMSMDEKERLVAKSMSAVQYQTLLDTLHEEKQQLERSFGLEHVSHFRSLVLSHDIYLDLPDQHIAFIQIEKYLTQNPEFYWYMTNKYWEKFRHLSVDKLVVTGFKNEGFYRNQGYWESIAPMLKSRLNNNSEVYEAFINWFERSLDGVNSVMLTELGSFLTNKMDCYKEAEATFVKAIELNNSGHSNCIEENTQGYLNVAKEKINKAFPWGKLGHLLHYHLNRIEEAEQAYRKSIELDANVAETWLHLGALLNYHLNRVDEAEQAYRKTIALDANRAHSWSSLGDLLQNDPTRVKEAEQAYNRAIELDVDYPVTYCNLARLYVFVNQFDKACGQYRRGLERISVQNHLSLQANLWLNNTDSANQALTALAEKANKGDNYMFYRIKEQCWECQQIDRGLALADLMANNRYVEFLKPFELALRKVNSDIETIKGAPVEIRHLAEEIAVDINDKLST